MCVYDAAKPVSRTEQLEEKVEELEGLLRSTSGQETAWQSLHSAAALTGLPPSAGDLASLCPSQSTSQPKYSVPPPNQQMDRATYDGQRPYTDEFHSFPLCPPGVIAPSHINEPYPLTSRHVDFNPFAALNESSQVGRQVVESSNICVSLDPPIMPILDTLDSTTASALYAVPYSGSDLVTPSPLKSTLVTSGSAYQSALERNDPAPTVSQGFGGIVPVQPRITIDQQSFFHPTYVPDVPNSSSQASGGFSLGLRGAVLGSDATVNQKLLGDWVDPADLPQIARNHL